MRIIHPSRDLLCKGNYFGSTKTHSHHIKNTNSESALNYAERQSLAESNSKYGYTEKGYYTHKFNSPSPEKRDYP